MNYASRAMQLAKEIDGQDLEPEFENIIEDAPTNTKEFDNGKKAYQALVKPTSIDLNRVGAHLAVSSIFEESPDRATDVYSYSTTIEAYDRVEAGIQTFVAGRASIQSKIVFEKHLVDFAVLHLGDHNLICAVNARSPDRIFHKMKEDLTKAFLKGDTTEVMRIMNVFFKGNNYSLWHLFKDQQRRILYQLLETTWQEITASFRHIYEHNYTIMQIMRGMNMPLPTALSTPAEFIINQDLCRVVQDEDIDLEQLKKIAEQATRLSLKLDKAMLKFEASRKINDMMRKFEQAPENTEMLDRIRTILQILLKLIDSLDIQTAQNSFFSISRETYPKMNEQASAGNEVSKKWIELFKNVAQYFNVKVD
jgi:hypothetical protein